jgi:hypothetical protein
MTYAFEGPTLVMDGEYDAFGEMWSAQWRAIASVHVGQDVRDPAHYAEILEDESEEGLVRFVQWRVTQDGRAAFDVWVVGVDGGIVFVADTIERTPINLIQGVWQSSSEDPTWKRICTDLEASAPGNLWF